MKTNTKITYQACLDYIEKRNWIVRNRKIILLFMILYGATFGVMTFMLTNAGDTSIRDQIRLERLKICQEEYKKSGINKQFIYGQIPAVRCATYMGLVYAFESNFGKSYKCVNTNNCLGMKGNGVNHPAGFIRFNSQAESRHWFANRYFKFHYKKNIETFVYDWSMTDQESYTLFIQGRFWEMHNELEQLYIRN